MIRERNIKITLILIGVLTVFLTAYLYGAGPNTITYQGTVTTSGGTPPSNGNYAMQFGLWDVDSGGTAGVNRLWLESYLNADAIAVTNGTFSVELGGGTSFPVGLFQNNPNLWLEVEVDLTGVTGSGLETFSPRVPFSATAYSFQSDNADRIDDLDSASLLRSDANDTCEGIIEFTAPPAGLAPSQASVQIHPSSFNPGDSIFSVWMSGSDMFVVDDTASMTTSGVIQGGTLYFPQAYNRLGDGTPTQTVIDASNDLLINGDLEVNGEVYWGKKTSYYSIPASDFVPQDDNYNSFQTAVALYKDSGDLTGQSWYASVHLPQGAVVTEFTVWFTDSSSEDETFYLRRRPFGIGTSDTLATVATSGTPGISSATDSSIAFATIDNSSYIYYLFFDFSTADTGSALMFCNACIEYTTTNP